MSILQGSVDRAQLDSLLETSRIRNAAIGVTGLLLVRDRQVMQILEGGEAEVQDLYVRIRHDPRHRDVKQVWNSTNRTRRFPDWSMGFDDLQGVSETQGRSGSEGSDSETAAVASELRTFLNRRIELLRRGLASGHRLVSALAVIMDAHDAETVVHDNGTHQIQCRQGCRQPHTDVPGSAGYPCPTVQNAFWALDATL